MRSDPVVALDRRTRRLHGDRLLLTPTGRLLRLGPAGPAQLADPRLLDPEGAFAARLVDAGAAHPLPGPGDPSDITVVIPVRDRVAALDRCLTAVGHDDVLVVDDGSLDPAALARVCHGRARLVTRAPGGPAAARNSALPLLHRPFVAFLDSDCVPPPGWLADLRGHLHDERVAAVAPRVRGGVRSPLDLGARASLVRPHGPVPYVPTAALVVRRSALTAFDEQLRYGEDVDLVWRLVEAGWQVRYDPRVVVEHEEPTRLGQRLARRHRYGTSAAPLSARHPGAVTHLVLPPLPAAAVLLLVAGQPLPALAAAALVAVRVDRHLDEPVASARVAGQSCLSTAAGLGQFLGLLGPFVWPLALRHRRLAALLVLPWLLEHRDRDSPAGRLRYVSTALVEHSAYGSGVLRGCARARSWRALAPRYGR